MAFISTLEVFFGELVSALTRLACFFDFSCSFNLFLLLKGLEHG
jgi:hypothetical protein